MSRDPVRTDTRHLFLSAGAGTGKTHELVQRYILGLERNEAEVPEIVCVTFTEKAVGELKCRLRSEITRRAAADTSGTVPWLRHLRNLETAPIHTIHGFCARILRHYALNAGLDPRFVVLDERQTTQLREDVARDFVFSRLRRGQSEDMLCLVEQLGLPAVLRLFPEFLAKGILWPSPLPNPPTEIDPLVASWERSCASVLSAEVERLARSEEWTQAITYLRNTEPRSPGCRVAERRTRLLAAWDIVTRPETPCADRVAAIQAMRSDASAQHMSTTRWDDPDRVKEALQAIRRGLDQLSSTHAPPPEVNQNAAARSLALAREGPLALAAYRSARDALSGIDFDELQTETWKLLNEQPELVPELQQEFRLFLIDEFQDTDDLQKRILWRVSGLDAPEGSAPHPRVFVVGDAKQSIYRFRGADVSVFNRTEAEFQARADSGVVALTRNYRTHQTMMEFVNTLFRSEAVMGCSPRERLFEARYTELRTERALSMPGPCVELLVAASSAGEAKSPIESLRIQEAAQVAERIAHLVRTRPFPVERRGSTEPPYLRWGDVAVLFRAMTDVAVYEHALRLHGVPYYVVSGRGLYSRQEVRDLIHFLRAVDNLRDDLALVGVLRSPFFGVCDDTLVWLAAGHSLAANLAVVAGRLIPQSPLAALAQISGHEREKLLRADRAIRHFRRVKDRLRLGHLIEAIITETGMTAALLTTPGGDQKVSNLRKLADLARSLERSGALSVRDFIRAVENLVVREEREGDAPTREEESDVVKLMTIHKAKGLEWPVVVIPDLGRRMVRRDESEFLFHPEFGPILRGETHEGERLWPWVAQPLVLEEKEREIAEHRRLLYVAVTRARDYLILSGTDPSGQLQGTDEPTWQNWLLRELELPVPPEANTDSVCPSPLGPVRIRVARAHPDQPAPQPASGDPEHADEPGRPDDPAPPPHLRVIEADTTCRHRITATELTEYHVCPRHFYLRRVRDMADYHWQRVDRRTSRISPTDRGTLVHEAVERFLHSPGTPPETIAQHVLRCSGSAHSTNASIETDIVTVLQRFQATHLFARFATSAHVQTEVPFALRWEPTPAGEDGSASHQPNPVVIEGAMDAIATSRDNQTILADFKTGSPRPAHDLFQLGIYAVVLRRLFGRPPAITAVYYLDTGISESPAPDRLIEVSSQTLGRCIGGILRQEFDRLLEVPCQACGLAWACDQRDDPSSHPHATGNPAPTA